MTAFLVTGAAGFIGSHVVEALLTGSRYVVGLDNFDDFHPRAVKERNLAGVVGSKAFRLVEVIAAALPAEGLPAVVRLERRPPQPGDVRRTCADVTKARRLLGSAPSTPVEDGIPRFVRWFKEEAHGRSS